MRLKTELWIKAYMRARRAAGAFVTVVAHGQDDAGALLITVNRLDGRSAVFGPAPMSLADPGDGDGDRRFARLHDAEWIPVSEAETLIAQQRSYDSDLWVVEVEDRTGESGLADWMATSSRQR
jgi:hypothetical protein